MAANNRGPVPRRQRVQEKMELVDESAGQHCSDECATPADIQVTVNVVLQLSDRRGS